MAEEAKPSKEELKAQLDAKKEELGAKRTEFTEFLKKNELKKGEDYSSHPDEKIAKSFRVKSKAIDALSAEVKELQGKAKEKSKGPAAPREAKYDYPEGLTSDEKKKFRIKMRANAKKVGVDVDEYLKDPKKHAATIATKDAEALKRKEEALAKGQAKIKEAAAAKKAEKAAPAETAAPAPKVKAKVKTKAAVVED